MNREEILEKSRKENKNADPYEQETLELAIRVAYLVMLILGTILARASKDPAIVLVLLGGLSAKMLVTAIRSKTFFDGLFGLLGSIGTIAGAIVYLLRL